MLFHFFTKKTQISDAYLLDPKSNLKLYPKQSGAVKPDALSSGFKLPNSEIDLIGKVEVCLHHKLSDLENLGFIWASQNTSGPDYATTGLYLATGKTAYYSYFKGSTSGGCAVSTGALEDDNVYILTTDFNTSNVVMKANKVTIVDNAKVIGSDINGSTTAKGTGNLTADIGILSGRTNSAYVYSSKHKIFWIKFYDKQGDLMHEFNFSEGAGSQTFDAVTGNAYDISNINPSLFWNYTQDFNHYNFRYGFTLYQKSGSPDIRVPNKKDQSEIILPAPPSGYSRVANYKECRLTFNQCENVFVLDDVSATEGISVAGAGNEILNGAYQRHGDYAGKSYWYDGDLSTYTHFFNWDGIRWNWGTISGTVWLVSYEDVEHPWLIESWTTQGMGVEPIGSVSQIALSPLKTADVDNVLFDEDGTAKEINISTLDVDLGFDRGYLYINPNISEHDFMLYGTDKTLKDDEKIIKYIGLKDEIVTAEVVNPETLEIIIETVVDENDHVVLE